MLDFINHFEKILPILIIVLSIIAAIMYGIKMQMCGVSANLKLDMIYWIAAAVLNMTVVFR